MAFEVFDAYGAASRPEATLRVSGYVFMSKSIQKRAGKEGSTHAQLSFDESTSRLGIELIDGVLEDTAAPSIREMSQEKSGVSVNVLPLLRYYGFDKPTRKHVLQVEFDGDMVIIDLSTLRPMPAEADE